MSRVMKRLRADISLPLKNSLAICSKFHVGVL